MVEQPRRRIVVSAPEANSATPPDRVSLDVSQRSANYFGLVCTSAHATDANVAFHVGWSR